LELRGLSAFSFEQMPLTPILTNETCAKCRNCCIFKKESLMYVPKGIDVKEQSDGQFVCVHRNENAGCALGKNKPVECAAWPFSVSKRGSELLLVLECSCPELKGTETVKKFAEKNIVPLLQGHSMQNLDTLREYDERNEIIFYILPSH